MLFSSARSESDVTRGPHRIELGFAEASDRKNQRELLLTNASPRFGRSGQGQLAQLNTSRGLSRNLGPNKSLRPVGPPLPRRRAAEEVKAAAESLSGLEILRQRELGPSLQRAVALYSSCWSRLVARGLEIALNCSCGRCTRALKRAAPIRDGGGKGFLAFFFSPTAPSFFLLWCSVPPS